MIKIRTHEIFPSLPNWCAGFHLERAEEVRLKERNDISEVVGMRKGRKKALTIT